MERLVPRHPGSSTDPVFDRLRWFYEELQSEADRSAPDTRWKAFLARQALEKSSPIRFNPPWFSLGPTNIAGRILSIAFDPADSRVLYVGSAGGGPWKSSDAGLSWLPIGDGLPTLAVGAIAVVRHDPRIVIIGTGEPAPVSDAIYGMGILRSTDGGSTWAATNVVSNPDSIRSGYSAIEVNPLTGVILAAGLDGLLRSTDDGATWTRVQSPAWWTDVKWRPGSSDTAYAAKEYGGLYMSTNAGVTFTHLSQGLPPDSSIGGLAKLAISPTNPDYVYAGLSSANSFTLLGIYRSTDAGATWSLRSAAPDLYQSQGYYNNTIIVDPKNPERVFVGGFLVYVSSDGGATWTDQWDFSQGSHPHVDNHGIAFAPGEGGHLWVATDGGLYELSEGNTWIDRNQGLATLQFYSVCQPSTTRTLAYGGSQDNGMLRYVGAPAWLLGPGGDGAACNCDPDDARHVYGEWEYGVHFVSRDGLETWSLINDGLFGQSRFIAPVDLDPSDSERLFTATGAGIFRSVDGGDNWQRVGDGSDIVSLSVSPVSPRWIWGLERSTGIVRRSSDGGESWVTSQAQPSAGIGGTEILADPADSLTAFCTFLSHPLRPPLVLRTQDGGVSWQDVTGNLSGQSVNTIAVDPDPPRNLYVGTSVGVWYSGSRGALWLPYGWGLPNAMVLDLAIHRKSRKIRAATHGRGLWEVALRSGVFDVVSANQALTLERASSNPGRGVMLFRYGGRGASPLELEIFTPAGRLVSRVAVDPADGYIRMASWDTRSVGSGVYIAVLTSGSVKVSRKVVVLR
jgi:photosystem II stability/assembly factor-like uncharacterized protein